MKRLADIGFSKVGHWALENSSLTLFLGQEQNTRNILYSFISSGEILYIGKTVQPLKKRMYGYQKPGPSQSTNIRNNRFITEKLAAGDSVEIYALTDNGLLHYGGFHVNLAAGLEDSLVLQLKPKWNHSGKK
ncbi:MAG: hypothetical protein C0622_08425 [Desulfuromonas sp.]|nr:MAG: hypothetical protein C0622_08425 [Desulfuromonas sp.]